MLHSLPSSARLRAKIGRSRRGMVNTYCRCGTGASTFVSTHSPYASTLFWWQLGQKYRALHEKARMYLPAGNPGKWAMDKASVYHIID